MYSLQRQEQHASQVTYCTYVSAIITNEHGANETLLAAAALLSGCGSALVMGNGMTGAGGSGWEGGLRISAGSLAAS